MSLTIRLQATFRQYEEMDRSVRILRSLIEQSHQNARDIDQALRVLKSGVSVAVPAFFGISFLGGIFAVMFLRVGQFIVDGIMGALSRWWAG